MIPRLRFDIGWRDLGYAAAACMRSGDPQALTAGLERAHGGEGRCVVALSVRSGFDALLQGLALPPGSEVLLSAITIPNMLDIVHAHGLRAVPLAVDPGSLGVAAGAIAAAITPHTRLIVVTHLLGGRMPMAAIADVAARHGIPLVEDAAQAFLGDGYRGAPGTLATMFSFGAIKTATALGGALLHIDDSDLAARMRQVLQSYPVLPRRWFLARLLRFAAASCLARRLPFTVFVGACRALGINDDRVLRKAVRGFRGRDLITEIRRAPPAPLLALLGRRLAQDVAARVRDRQARGERLARCLGDLARPGQEAGTASYWVFPVFDADPVRRARLLAAHGVDATAAASTLAAITRMPGDSGKASAQPLTGWLYLPQPEWLSDADCVRIASALQAARRMDHLR